MAECKSIPMFFRSYNTSISWFLVLLILPAVYADTRGSNSTTVPEPAQGYHTGWHDGPPVRGTWSILWTCVTTLFIAIWTVIHDEVEHNGSERDRVLSKFNWMFYTALQPQHTTLCAAAQWIKARSVHQLWCKTFNIKPGSIEDRLGRQGAYFIIMGGYTVGPCDYFGRYPSLLDADSFQQLLEDGAISSTSINQKLIEDRGKADAIAKAVTLIQAIGLVYTCIVRLIFRLPITVLEVHVVIHVFWAAAIYTLWWNKPLSVNEPISIIEHKEIGDALAVLYPQNMPLLMAILPRKPLADEQTRPIGVSTQPKTQQGNVAEVLDVPSDGCYIRGDSVNGTSAPRVFKERIENVVFVEKNRSLTDIPKYNIEGWTPDQITQRRKGDHILILPGESLIIQDRILIKYCGLNSEKTFNLTRVEIDKLVEEANQIRGHSEKDKEYLGAKSIDETAPSERLREYLSSFIGTKVPKRKIKLGHSQIRGKDKVLQKIFMTGSKSTRITGILALSALTSIEGIVHLAAWKTQFPSVVEYQLWRIACMGVIVVSWFWAFLVIVFLDSNVTRGAWWLQFPTTCFMFACGLYFVVEAFIGLRRLPNEAFKDAGIEDILKLF